MNNPRHHAPPQLGWWSKLPLGVKLLAIGLLGFTLISLTLFSFQIWISIQNNFFFLFILLGISIVFSGCDVQINTCGGNCPQGNSHTDGGGTGGNPSSGTTPTPPNNGADTPGQGTAIATGNTCENWNRHPSGTTGTETVTVDLPNGCTLVAWGINVHLGGNLEWTDGGIGAIQGPAPVSGTISDGEFQMGPDTQGQQKYCDVVAMHTRNHWDQTHHVPLPGWGSCQG
jgi:hypothetical protein